MVKIPKLHNKEVVLKAAREKWQLIYKNMFIRITKYLLAED
jgi:hypothetical protein